MSQSRDLEVIIEHDYFRVCLLIPSSCDLECFFMIVINTNKQLPLWGKYGTDLMHRHLCAIVVDPA